MVRVVALAIAVLSLSPWLARGQEVAASPRCVNCDDPELLAWLQPLDPEAERYVCALEVQLEIEADGRVVAADPVDEAPLLCERRATQWALATRWELPEGAAPLVAVLPLEFEIQHSIKPRCLERCDPNRVLEELRLAAEREDAEGPSYARRGFRCETTIGLRIDEEGRVTDTDVLSGSRERDCVRVLRRWAERSRWSPAYNRGAPVVVWIAQPASISTD